MASLSFIKALGVIACYGKGPGHALAVIAFNDALDRKTAETLMFSVIILLVIFLFVYFSKKQVPDKTR